MSRNKRHPWLDKTDPANCANSKGFWVPSPEEIEKACAVIRKKSLKARKYMLWCDSDERKRFRPRDEFPLLLGRREPTEEFPRLCDCPYWGTEFEQEQS